MSNSQLRKRNCRGYVVDVVLELPSKAAIAIPINNVSIPDAVMRFAKTVHNSLESAIVPVAVDASC